MSFVGSLFSNSQGAGYQAQSVPLEQAVTTAQTNQAYQNTQTGLAQQMAFIQALQAQNGIQNQSDVYQQQQALANQLQLQTQGGGPNPAMAQLAQSTAANTANQAALMASQRGTSQNAGLIARQAAQVGASNQENTSGQAAVLRAQQQLAAQQQLQQQQNMLAGLSTQQVGQQGGAISGYNQMAQSEQQNLLNAVQAYNNAQVGMQSNINTANANIASGNQAFQSKAIAAPFNLAATALVAHGGEIQNLKRGGKVPGQAKVEGDSYSNDTVPAMLSPKEIVLPRSVTMSQDAPEKAKQFVIRELSKRYQKGGEVKSENSESQEDIGPQPEVGPQSAPQNPVSLPFLQAGKNFLSNLIGGTPAYADQVTYDEDQNPENQSQNPSSSTPTTSTSVSSTSSEKPVVSEKDIYQPQTSDLSQESNADTLKQLPGTETFEKPISEISKAVEEEAQAKGKAGQQQAAAYQQGQQNLQNTLEDYQKRVVDLNQKIQSEANEVKSGNVNPGRYWENLGTVGRIQAGIGLALGAIGSTFSGGQNPAMQFIQNEIDRDIESQKVNLGKKENLLSHYMRQFGNVNDAMSMTKATQLAITAAQIEKAGALSQNPIEQAKAQQMANQLRLQYGPTLSEIGIRQTLLNRGAQNEINPAISARFLASNETERNKALEEVKQQENINALNQNAMSAFDKVSQLQHLSQRAGSPIQSSKQIDAAWDPMIDKITKNNEGRVTPITVGLMESLKPKLTDSSDTVNKKRERLLGILNSERSTPTLNSIGINMNKSAGMAKPNLNTSSQYLAKR